MTASKRDAPEEELWFWVWTYIPTEVEYVQAPSLEEAILRFAEGKKIQFGEQVHAVAEEHVTTRQIGMVES